VIAPRYGDIFHGNALKMGLLIVVLPESVVQQLWDDIEQQPATDVTVDVDAREVRWADKVHPFELDDYTRWRLMEGLDDIGITLQHMDDVIAYEGTRKPWLPTVQV
jgi:3-isopropylmalate/(R)-2-methylmalate dehydratase small subunit